MAGMLRTLGGSLRSVWGAYERQLHSQPMRTQAITSGALWCGLESEAAPVNDPRR